MFEHKWLPGRQVLWSLSQEKRRADQLPGNVKVAACAAEPGGSSSGLPPPSCITAIIINPTLLYIPSSSLSVASEALQYGHSLDILSFPIPVSPN